MGNGSKIQIGLQNLNTETNAYGVRTTEIGRQVSNAGSGNSYRIGASTDSFDNTHGTRIVKLNSGLDSHGDGNSFVIGLQNLASENNQGGVKVVEINRQVSNSGSGNTYRIGASADSVNN